MVESANSPDAMDVRPYEILCDQIKPGDAITFSGSDIPSTVVKVATRSEYVHIAIVMAVDPAGAPGDRVIIAESHVDTRLPSLGTGRRSLGVQIQRLADRLALSPGPAWWSSLKTPLTAVQLAVMQSWLQQLEQQQVPYDFVQAIEAGLESLGLVGLRSQPDSSAFFCSELVTRALQLVGAVEPEINPSEQTPIEVLQFPCFAPPVLIKGE